MLEGLLERFDEVANIPDENYDSNATESNNTIKEIRTDKLDSSMEVFFKTQFFGHSGRLNLPRLSFLRESEQFEPLPERDSARRKSSQNVSKTKDIYNTLMDPIIS